METSTMRVTGVPPPLPPKTRRSTGAVATGHGGGANNISQGTMNLVSTSQTSITSSGEHVVKIRINPGEVPTSNSEGCIRISVGGSNNNIIDNNEMVRRTTGGEPASAADTFIKERGNPYFFCNSFQCQTNGMVISSGQSSPSDTLDSGTCSDLDGSTPPPLPKKGTISSSAGSSTTVTVTVNGNNHHNHRRTGSLTSSGAEVDSDDDVGSNISCDSLNHEDIGTLREVDEEEIQNQNIKSASTILTTHLKNGFNANENIKVTGPAPPPMKNVNNIPKSLVTSSTSTSNGFLPQGLLQDIRDRSAKLTIVPATNAAAVKKTKTWKEEATVKMDSQHKSPTPEPKEIYQKQQSSLYRYHNSLQITPSVSPVVEETSVKKNGIVEERTYEERSKERSEASPEPSVGTPGPRNSYKYEDDRFYKFHLREHEIEEQAEVRPQVVEGDEETFAGLKDLLGEKDKSATIRSAKGTVRGVKNRVRAGIATFLQFPDTKNYKEKEVGKVVVYTTTMGIVRVTSQECLKVKKILRTLLVKYEERDVFMSREVQAEIRERMHSDVILVPQVFVEGQHIGDAETIDRLNETGELRRILKPFKSPDACNTCQVCGGFRLLPCSVCNGSKKSVHRNDFTAEFVALKCMNCDEVGLVRCYAC